MKTQRSTYNFFTFCLIIILFTQCAASKQSKTSEADRVIQVAKSYIGTPYKWGGSSKKGMDCSGLVLTSFQSVNKKLPRTVVEQSKIGKDVDIASLRRGDLLIFRIKRKKKGRVWHTGIVTEVVNKDKIMFIHASSSKGVTLSNLMSDYYQKYFKKARRII